MDSLFNKWWRDTGLPHAKKKKEKRKEKKERKKEKNLYKDLMPLKKLSQHGSWT